MSFFKETGRAWIAWYIILSRPPADGRVLFVKIDLRSNKTTEVLFGIRILDIVCDLTFRMV